MGGFWEVCFLRKAQEPRHPKPGFPGFRAFALHSSATLPNGFAAPPILAARQGVRALAHNKIAEFLCAARKLAGVGQRPIPVILAAGKAYSTLKLTILWKSFKKNSEKTALFAL